MEVLHNRPVASSFTPLAEHQARTPVSFYDGPPVLHFHSDRCKVLIVESELNASLALKALRGPVIPTNGHTLNGSSATTTTAVTEERSHPGDDHEDELKEVLIDGVDIWVASEYVLADSHQALRPLI
jgi:chloride channel, nucleotide-sensitive, 1A